MPSSFDSGFDQSFGDYSAKLSVRNPCNCGSRLEPLQHQDEGSGLDIIECRTCGLSESIIGYDECIALWNSVHTGAWE